MSLSSLKTSLQTQVNVVQSSKTNCQASTSALNSTKYKVWNNATTYTDTDLAAYINAQSDTVSKNVALASALKDENITLNSIITQSIKPTSLVLGSATDTSVTVSFTNHPTTISNTITATPSSGPVVSTTFTSGSPYTLSGLTPSTSYTISLTALTDYGTSVAATLSASTTSPGSSSDPNVWVYLTGEGATLKDYSLYNRTVTVANVNSTSNPVVLSAANYKVGTQSVYISDTGAGALIDLGSPIGSSTDMTLETWFLCPVAPSTSGAFLQLMALTDGHWSNDGVYLLYMYDDPVSTLRLVDNNANGNAGNRGYVGLFPSSDWVHIAVVKHSSTWTVFINGASAMSFDVTTTSLATVKRLVVGATNYPFAGLTGWYDNVTLTVGVAKYTANFTPS